MRAHHPKLTTRLQRYSGLLSGGNTRPAPEDGLLAWEGMVWRMHSKDGFNEAEPRVPIYKVNEGREPRIPEQDDEVDAMRNRFFDLRTTIKEQMAKVDDSDDDDDDEEERLRQEEEEAMRAAEDGWVEISEEEAAEAARAEAQAAAEREVAEARARAADARKEVPRQTLFVGPSANILATEPPDEELSMSFAVLRDSLRGMKEVRKPRPLQGVTPVSIRPAAQQPPDYMRMTASLSAGGFRAVPAVPSISAAVSPRSPDTRGRLMAEVHREAASAGEGLSTLLREATSAISALGAEASAEPLTFAALQASLRSQQRRAERSMASPF